MRALTDYEIAERITKLNIALDLISSVAHKLGNPPSVVMSLKNVRDHLSDSISELAEGVE